MVVTTPSQSFDITERYGANTVFNYQLPTAISEISKAYPNTAMALVCFSKGKSSQFCA